MDYRCSEECFLEQVTKPGEVTSLYKGQLSHIHVVDANGELLLDLRTKRLAHSKLQ